MTLADVGIQFQHRVGIVAEVRFADERLGGNVRVVHLHEIHIHEERLVALGVLLDVIDRRIGLPDVELMQIVVVDARDLGRGFAGRAFPFVQVDDLLILRPSRRR